jgi:hypothetical protein
LATNRTIGEKRKINTIEIFFTFLRYSENQLGMI